MLRWFFAFVFFFFSFATNGYAAEVPGGTTRIADISKIQAFELMIGPSYVMSPTGAYLNSELRFQTSEDFAVGFGFGAGEPGFNFGASGTWYIAPDLENQPAIALMGGAYFNRLRPENYFVVKVAPIVSKTMKTEWGKLTPYASLHVTPSFRLTSPANELSLKTSLGTLVDIKELHGSRLFGEVDIGVVNSVHEIIVGVVHPL